MYVAKSIPVVEVVDVTDRAATLGWRCGVSMTQALSERLDCERAVALLNDVLVRTRDDPKLAAFRAVALKGERPPRLSLPAGASDELQLLVDRARAGIGGVSEGGTMLALPFALAEATSMMLCQLGFGILRPRHAPGIVLSTVEEAMVYIERIAARALR